MTRREKIEALTAEKHARIQHALDLHGTRVVAIAWPDGWSWNANDPQRISIGEITND